MENSVPPLPSPAPKKRGCFFVGCLSLLALLVLGAGACVIVIPSGIKKLVNQYTEANPMPLPKSSLSQDQLAPIAARIKEFRDGMDKEQPSAALVLANEELNALLASSPDAKKLKDKLFLSIEGDQLKCAISYPLPKTRFMDLTGRYFNGEAGIKVSLSEGVLIVTIDSLNLHEHKLPESFLQVLRSKNIASNIYEDVELSKTLRKLESIEIKDGKMTIKARSN